jgi:hypothetical protein
MTPLRSQKKKPKSALAEEETPRKKEENFREVREENSPPRKWNFKPPETPQFHSAADIYWGLWLFQGVPRVYRGRTKVYQRSKVRLHRISGRDK